MYEVSKSWPSEAVNFFYRQCDFIPYLGPDPQGVLSSGSVTWRDLLMIQKDCSVQETHSLPRYNRRSYHSDYTLGNGHAGTTVTFSDILRNARSPKVELLWLNLDARYMYFAIYYALVLVQYDKTYPILLWANTGALSLSIEVLLEVQVRWFCYTLERLFSQLSLARGR